jgi:hypothetical protein
MESQENQIKSISDKFPEQWAALTRNQRRYVVAMLDSPSKKEAAEMIGMKPDTIYHWNSDVDDLIATIEADRQAAALVILSNQAPMAAMVKVAGLESGNESVRQGASTEILDRVLGKPMQRQEITGKGGKPLIPFTQIITSLQQANDRDRSD